MNTIAPLCRPHAEIVDALRDKLPPQYLSLDAIGTLLAINPTARPDEAEVLAALLYLERRGEVQRSPHRGWRLQNGCQSAVTCRGPQGSRQLEASYEAQVGLSGATGDRGPGLFNNEV